MITTLTQKLWKKIRAGTAALCLLSACGDETKLVHYDAPPLPRAVDPREVGKMPPPQPRTPTAGFQVTFRQCLGLMAEPDSSENPSNPEYVSSEEDCPEGMETDRCDDHSFEEICPRIRETGLCDENFTRVLREHRDTLQELVREKASLDLFDTLEGRASIPITAIAWYSIHETGTESTESFGVRGIFRQVISKIDITFGNNVTVLQEYLQGGVYGDDIFPLDRLGCTFYRSEDTENVEYTIYSLDFIYQKDGEKVINLLLGYRDTPHPPPRDHRATLIDYYAHQVFQYYPEEFDIGVTGYVVRDAQEDGEDRVEELLEIRNFDYVRRGLFYWE